MIEYITVLIISLLITTFCAAWEYYRHISKAHREYIRARSAVEDVILSINREMRREASKLEVIEYKVAGIAGKVETAVKKEDSMESRVATVEKEMGTVNVSTNSLIETITSTSSRITNIEKAFEALSQKVANFVEPIQKASTNLEDVKEPVIQLRRDKAIGSLTDTEITVLEFLAKKGAKTAPEIKETVRLSREHTARLMKKLYESGYVERETNKIPFSYSVKKEMEKLLGRPQVEEA